MLGQLFVVFFLTLLTSIAAENPDEGRMSQDGWLTVAACRAKCLHKFVGNEISDHKCIRHLACSSCWHQCEEFHSSGIREHHCATNSTNKCTKGCKTACRFYARLDDVAVGRVTGQEWVFPVRVAARFRGGREMSMSWTRPRLISRKKELVMRSARVSVVYVVFVVENDHISPRKIFMTCNTKSTIRFAVDIDPDLTVLLIAVSAQGELARQSAGVHRLPARVTPPTPGVIKLPTRAHSLPFPVPDNKGNGHKRNNLQTKDDNAPATTIPANIPTTLFEERETNVIWILTTVLLFLLVVLGCLMVVVYFSCDTPNFLSCTSYRTPTNFRLNNGAINPSSMEEMSEDFELPGEMFQTSIVDPESGLVLRHSTPYEEDGVTEHLVTVDVHQGQSPSPTEAPSPIPYRESRQDLIEYCDLLLPKSEQDDYSYNILPWDIQCTRKEIRDHVMKVLCTAPPVPPPRLASLHAASTTCSFRINCPEYPSLMRSPTVTDLRQSSLTS